MQHQPDKKQEAEANFYWYLMLMTPSLQRPRNERLKTKSAERGLRCTPGAHPWGSYGAHLTKLSGVMSALLTAERC